MVRRDFPKLGNKKFVDVREFKGKIYVDIREYYEKDGEMRPGKKGISLSTEHWEVRETSKTRRRRRFFVAIVGLCRCRLHCL